MPAQRRRQSNVAIRRACYANPIASLEIPLVKRTMAAFHINITCRLVLSRGKTMEMARGAVSEAPDIS